MSTRSVLVAALFTASAATAAVAAPVRHAGEWRTTMGNGMARISCFPTDESFDEKTIMHTMAQLPGASCTMNSLNTVGPVTSYSMQCTIQGSVMTSSGTVIATGPDSFTSKAHSHGGAIPMGDGKVMAMPDMDITTTSQRLGPCKPGDHVVKF